MARYRKIDPRIWNDAKFSALSSEGKLLFLYLLTAPAMTMIGAMPMRASAVAEELGFDSKRYAIRYQELSQMGIVEYDDRGLFWVKNFLKYNAPDNPKVVISWGSILDLLPECPLLTKVLKSAQAHCLQRGEGYAEAFSKSFGNGIAYGMPNPMPYQEQEQEQEQEKNIYAPDGASVSEDQKTERPSPIKKPADVSKEDWANYLKLRKQKRLPLTALALQEMEHEAEKAGKPMAEVVRICLKNSWAGFKASWLTKPQHGSQQPVMQQTSFADLDYSEGINPDGTF